MNKQQHPKTINHTQPGMVSILISMTMIVVISLITLSFWRIMSREQTQGLDQQLSSTAFYAAESAINKIQYDIKEGKAPANSSTCGTVAGPTFADYPTISVPCVLVDASPNELKKDALSEQSWIVPLEANNGAKIKELTISWSEKNGNSCFANAGCNSVNYPNFPPKSQWNNGPGVVRMTLIPVNDGAVDYTVMDNNTFDAFLYGTNQTGSAVDFGQAVGANAYNGVLPDNGEIIAGNCSTSNTPGHCRVTINNLAAVPNTYYVLRLKALYNPVNVTVSAIDTSDNKMLFKNAQIKLDATGRVASNSRRIQVRVPSSTTIDYPEFALEVTDGICKRYQVFSGSATVDDTNPSITDQSSPCALPDL